MGSSSAGPLRIGGGFSFAAPIPPLAFSRGQARVACLGHGSLKNIQDTGILALAGEPFEARVHFLGVLFGKLRDRVNAEPIKVAQHGGPNGDEVMEEAVGSHGSPFYVSLYFRHRVKH